ncbi:MAG: primosomal protein N' [Oscillatoria sp. PMC 1051.18]|nr:primosomal protein N' [Oscillatoria sp. PMC 1050.18]MEC5031043.1 primosomal protein N' [Oscillatoria sp. PMC 1051.18]
MSNLSFGTLLAEPRSFYDETRSQGEQWVEVLVDVPGSQEAAEQRLYTYRLPPDLAVEAGDIISVPFGAQTVGGIAIRFLASPPAQLELSQIKNVEEVIATGFFPRHYWQLLEQLAQYYCTSLLTAIKVALPPGLLGRSQRRIRLKPNLPAGAENFCNSAAARQILALLQSQANVDYSTRYLQRQVKGVNRGIKELIKRNWVESYLEPPRSARPKQQKVVTFITEVADLTSRQREVLAVLRRWGGELWLNQLLKICSTSSSIVKKLAEKGCVAIAEREVLRLANEPPVAKDSPKILTQAQSEALQLINNLSEFRQVLLHGITGSGKTEIYLQAIAPILAQGKSAIVLVPEIGLTPQLTDRFRARFGNSVCVYHSALNEGERFDTWRQMLAGEPQVIIGTRSAIFAPLPNLGVIILDEEHDSSFKQDRPAPTYHARQVAKWRAELANCPLILGSATPSLETWVEFTQENSQTTTHHYLSLPERIQSRPLPPIEIVDLRQELQQGNRSIFSRSLYNSLQQLQNRQQQGILFIPRRGHSTFVSCRSCGYVIECPHCDVSLSYHYTHEGATELLRCHYCNHTQLQPSQCPECSSPYLKHFGTGTQRVAQELAKVFPELRFIRFDSDTTRTKGAHRTLLTRFTRKEADLLIGTQMLTKGLDIANVTLVGVVAADGLLHMSDYRAAERAFQTLTQVAGRAGRGNDPGRVIIQTYTPEHQVIEAVQEHNYLNFTQAELREREAWNYPPYGRLILLKISGLDAGEVQENAEIVADACRNFLDSQWEILGPAPARIMRVARRYRWQILLKSRIETDKQLPNLTQLKSLCSQSVSFTIDIDPLNMD